MANKLDSVYLNSNCWMGVYMSYLGLILGDLVSLNSIGTRTYNLKRADVVLLITRAQLEMTASTCLLNNTNG